MGIWPRSTRISFSIKTRTPFRKTMLQSNYLKRIFRLKISNKNLTTVSDTLPAHNYCHHSFDGYIYMRGTWLSPAKTVSSQRCTHIDCGSLITIEMNWDNGKKKRGIVHPNTAHATRTAVKVTAPIFNREETAKNIGKNMYINNQIKPNKRIDDGKKMTT